MPSKAEASATGRRQEKGRTGLESPPKTRRQANGQRPTNHGRQIRTETHGPTYAASAIPSPPAVSTAAATTAATASARASESCKTTLIAVTAGLQGKVRLGGEALGKNR